MYKHGFGTTIAQGLDPPLVTSCENALKDTKSDSAPRLSAVFSGKKTIDVVNKVTN